MAVDPRLPGVPLGITDPFEARLAALSQQVASLRREVADLRAAASTQIGSGTPAGFAPRDGTLYGQTNATLWLKLPTGWRGVSLPLT